MFTDLLTHEYFWLSFLPVVCLSGGFWLLYFDRLDSKNEPLYLLFIALLAGAFSAVIFVWIFQRFVESNLSLLVLSEEFCKAVCAVLAMELVKARFETISQGIMYGFAVGLGFAVVEDLVYLMRIYESVQFDPAFWIVFQGRFWSSTLVHGLTMAFFGLYYSAAYLSPTVNKGGHESPLKVLFAPMSFQALWQVLTLHVTRMHLLLHNHKDLQGHLSRSVISEGFVMAFFVHLIFNLILSYSMPALAFLFGVGGLWFLGYKSKKL